MKRKTVIQNSNWNPELAARVGRALVRAGESARRTARMHGTAQQAGTELSCMVWTAGYHPIVHLAINDAAAYARAQ